MMRSFGNCPVKKYAFLFEPVKNRKVSSSILQMIKKLLGLNPLEREYIKREFTNIVVVWHRHLKNYIHMQMR